MDIYIRLKIPYDDLDLSPEELSEASNYVALLNIMKQEEWAEELIYAPDKDSLNVFVPSNRFEEVIKKVKEFLSEKENS